MAIPLLCSTRNAHKLGEIRATLGPAFEVGDLSTIPELGEVEESGVTFEENAALKALAASRFFSGWVLADDSGLEVDALGGEPGVRSARFAGELATDSDNRHLLIQRLLALPSQRFAARFRCTMVIAKNQKIFGTFHGTVEGHLIPEARGGGGFGYDPLFIPEGHAVTFAELPAELKNTLSHRARALHSFRNWAAEVLTTPTRSSPISSISN